MPNPKLYILGRGDAPLAILHGAVDDQLAAAAFNPIDMEFWVLEGEEEPAAIANIAAYIDDEYEGLEYQWLQNRDGSSLLDGFRNSVSALGDVRRARVLVLWDESTATRQAVQAALDAGIEVYDLSDALTRIGSLASEDNNDKELTHMPRTAKKTETEPKVYTEDEMLEMSEKDLAAVAESYGIDHDSYPDWESVIAVVLEKQEAAAGDGETEPAGDEPAGDEEEEETGGYTRAELEGMELDTLKEICRVNNIEVEGQRPRAPKYIEAILEAQGGEAQPSEAADNRDAGDEGAPGAEEEEEEEEPIYSGEDIANLLGSIQGDTASAADAAVEAKTAVLELAEGLDKALHAIFDEIKALRSVVEDLAAQKAPAAANGTAPAKAVAIKKVAGVRKLAKPQA